MTSIDHAAMNRAAAVKRFTETADLTLRVEAIFAEESRGRPKRPKNPPSQDGYGRVAGALIAIRNRQNAAPLRKDVTRVDREEASKSARKFLRHLQPLTRYLTGYDEQLELLDAATKAVEALLPELDRSPIAPSPDNKPVRHIAHQVKEAWAETNDGKAPKSDAADDLLVSVVVRVLSLININQGREKISSILKGRR